MDVVHVKLVSGEQFIALQESDTTFNSPVRVDRITDPTTGYERLMMSLYCTTSEQKRFTFRSEHIVSIIPVMQSIAILYKEALQAQEELPSENNQTSNAILEQYLLDKPDCVFVRGNKSKH